MGIFRQFVWSAPRLMHCLFAPRKVKGAANASSLLRGFYPPRVYFAKSLLLVERVEG